MSIADDWEDELYKELADDRARLDWLLGNTIIQYYPTWHPMDLYRIEEKWRKKHEHSRRLGIRGAL